MKVVIFSYKECWVDPRSPSGYATVGGFPYQMQAVSDLFDASALVVPIRKTPLPPGGRPLRGRALCVEPLKEPAGTGLTRKIARLVRDIRTIEAAMGDGVKRVYDSERPILNKLRRVRTSEA